MPTKISSYLTELGFRQIESQLDIPNYNKNNAGEFLVVKESNKLYRYSADSGAIVDNNNIFNTSDGGQSRWITVGGASTSQTRVNYTFTSTSNIIPLGMQVTSKNNILYVNINNTQILSSEYQLNEAKDAVVLSQSFKAGVSTEVVLFLGDFPYVTQDQSYSELLNKPSINGVVLDGNKSLDALGIQPEGDYVTRSELETDLNAKADKSTTYTKTETNNLLNSKIDTVIPTAGGNFATLSATGELLDGGKKGALSALDSVGQAQINANAITTEKIVDGEITNAKLADSTIEGGKIAHSTITNVNISADANIAQSKVENLISSLDAKADKENTYTKTEIDTIKTGLDTKIAGKADEAHSLSGYGIMDAYDMETVNTLLDEKADILSIPTKVSQLTNDSNFQSDTQVSTSIQTHDTSTTAHADIRTLVSTETTNRTNEDRKLQEQIDAITSKSDVVDIVGTYADLQAYDTASLSNNNIIKVLNDSEHDNTSSYYKWVITDGAGSWVYVGSEAVSYTKAEADNKFVEQTTTVNDKALSSNITLAAVDVNALPDTTKYGANLELNGQVLQLKDQDGNNIGNSVTINHDIYTAGEGISIDENGVISNTKVSAEWGKITGTLSNQTDLATELNNKQASLTPDQLAAVNSGITSTKVGIYDGYAATIEALSNDKQTVGNMTSTLTTETSTYPSNKAVSDALSQKDSLPPQENNANKFLKTNGTAVSWADLPTANTTTSGIVKLASAEEITAGTSTTSAVSVKNLTDSVNTLNTALTTGLEGKADKSDTYTKTEIDAKLYAVYTYKGTVATYNALPTENLASGDVYNVEDTGINYAWNGTEWDALGTTVDLSGYYTKTETDNLLTTTVRSDTIRNLVSLTQAEYNALEVKDPATVYFISDNGSSPTPGGGGTSTDNFTSVFQKIETVSEGVITLSSNSSIYDLGTITGDLAVSFNLASLTIPSGSLAITFEVYLSTGDTIGTITWPSALTWMNEITPTFEVNKKYLFAFRSFDRGTSWIGNVQCNW